MSRIPGPFSLPIIGNVHQLGSKPHESLTKLSQRYGEVFRIMLGTRLMVVLSGSNAIKQALNAQTIDFAGRPEDLAPVRAFNSVRGGTIAQSTYGDGWEFLHRFLVTALREFTDGAGKDIFERNVSEEALKLTEFVTKDTSPIFDAEVLLNHSTVNLLTRLMFSSHYELDDPMLGEFREVNEELWFHWEGSAILIAFPWLECILPSKMSNLVVLITRQLEILKSYRDKRDRDYIEGSKSDLLSVIKTESAHLDPDVLREVGLTREKLHDLVFEVFGGGHGSWYAFLNWAFLYAVAFPEIQKEIQEEIDNVVGRERIPTFADREKLPLTEAFLAEVSRHSSLSPLTPPHCTTKDTVLGGGFDYAIAEGTMVLCNLHSVFNDPNEWENPEQFNPKRFLNEDTDSLDTGKVNSIMRFSGGIRMCTGRKVATLQIFLFFAIVMHQCSLKNVASQKLSLEGIKFPIGQRPPKTKMEMQRR